MATRHVLCVHGIGSHTDDWINSPDDGDISFNDLFLDRWNNLQTNHDYRPRHDIKLYSIHYNDAIERLLGNWVEQLELLSNRMSENANFQKEKDFFDGLIEKAKPADDQRSFLLTHILDLLVFASLYSVQDSIITKVGNQIGQILKDEVDYNRGDQACVIGHSMGSSVVEKTLKALFSESVSLDGLKFRLQGNEQLAAVMLVANVSYTLARKRDAFYDSIFRPGGDEMRIMKHLLNANHKLDPVGNFKPFDPYRHNPDWLPAEDQDNYHNLEISRLSSPMVHSINHYFRDPNVYLPLFEILGGRSIAKTVLVKLRSDFETDTPLGKFRSARESLKELDVTDARSMKEFYEKVKALSDYAREFKK
tara:strand:+ start:8146 stop:9237 length:1092 start_codon:yes stop_codon:yes gene_type:complete